MSSALVALHLFQSLTDLDLTDTLIVEAALPYQIAAKRLQRLNISRTRMTAEGVAALRRHCFRAK